MKTVITHIKTILTMLLGVGVIVACCFIAISVGELKFLEYLMGALAIAALVVLYKIIYIEYK